MFRRYSPFFLLLLAFQVSAPADAQNPYAIGEEFAVNTITTTNQGLSRTAVDADGNFVVVWEASGALDGNSWGIFGRQFDAAGTPLAGEFQVNTYTTGLQVYPSIAMRDNGDFVVAWQSLDQDSDDFGVYAQRFDSEATKVGNEIAVSSTFAGYQGNANLAYRDDGGFLVIWENESATLSSDDVFGQLFDSAGNALGGELLINTTTASDQHDPRIASTPDGFVAVWESLGQDGDSEAVVMQLFDADAAPVGGELQVNEYTTSDQEDPELTVSADGSFAIVWESEGQDGSFETAMGRIFNSDGMPRTGEFQINTTVFEDQEEVEVAADANGGFLAVWESTAQLGDGDFEDVFGQRFDSQGQLLGDEFLINTFTASDQDAPNIVSTSNQRFIVTWRDSGQYAGPAGVFGQLYDIPTFSDGFESGDTSAWTSSTP